MNIPTCWSKAHAEIQGPDGRNFMLSAWGWGNDDLGAEKKAAERLKKMSERVRRGEPFPDGYGYGERPVREEILETIAGDRADEVAAVLTRNRYGAVVLNTSTLLFLDIDLQPETFVQKVFGLFGAKSGRGELEVLDRLRAVLKRYRRATFRIYRTAAGLRAIAIDREFNPAHREVTELMELTGCDPAYSRLCKAQQSFRARLTPKPWRCALTPPPVEYPRCDDDHESRFAAWLADYDAAGEAYATCRFLETIGSGRPSGLVQRLLEIHDGRTKARAGLPLA